MSDLSLSEEQVKAIKGYCQEMSASMTRTEGERTFQSEATKALAKEHELDKSMVKKMAKIFHKSQFLTVRTENEQLEESYQKVFGVDAI